MCSSRVRLLSSPSGHCAAGEESGWGLLAHSSLQCPLPLVVVPRPCSGSGLPVGADCSTGGCQCCGLSTVEPGPHLDALLLDPASTDAPSAPSSAAVHLQSPTPPAEAASLGTDPGICIVGRTSSSGPSTSTSSPCPLPPVAATETWKLLAPPWSTCSWTSAKG